MYPQLMSASLLKAWIYIPPVILVVGTVGNMLILFTLTRRHLKKSSFTTYLTALAITDTVNLYVWTVNEWLFNAFGLDLNGQSRFVCKTTLFAMIGFGYTSAWLVAALAVERAFCTFAPHLVRSVCRPKTGCIVTGIIACISVALGSHTIFGIDLIYYEDNNMTLCGFTDDGYEVFMMYYYTWIDFMAASFLPATIIIVANVATVTKVVRTRSPVTTSTLDVNRNKRIQHMRTVTILVSIAFTLLTVPSTLYQILKIYVFDVEHPFFTSSATESIVYIVVYNMYFLNYGINFFLYIVSGERFRTTLKDALCQCAGQPSVE